MTATSSTPPPAAPVTGGRDDGGKGLRTGSLGLLSSVVIGVASTAPAYSLAATLGGIVVLVNLHAPAIVVLAFVPILFVSIGYQQLNKREPDCGTTFTWATKAFGPIPGWLGGWGIIAADVLVMASLAQVAGQYVFLLVGADGIGSDASSPWVLLVGLIWMALMTWICYRGIEVSARIQQVLLALEVVVLVIFAVTALVKVANGSAGPQALTPSLSWFNPFSSGASLSDYTQGLVYMLFIYWGWDSAVAVNEETKDRDKTPGRAAVISTVLLLVTYVIVTLAAQSYAGVGDTGIGLANPDNSGDILGVLGAAVFGTSTFGTIMVKALVLLVLTSAAASTQTTILPTARTTLSMAVYKAIPATFAKIHPRYLTPTSSTIWMGVISALLYLAMNFYSSGTLIADAVTGIGMMIAFYYGLTGFACAWYYRKELQGVKNFLLRGLIPFLGGLLLFGGLVWTVWKDFDPINSYTVLTLGSVQIGWAFVLGVGVMVVGVILMFVAMAYYKPFFRGETLNRDTPILAPEDDALVGVLPDSRENLVLPPDSPLRKD